jgi:hypothetical protein
MTCRDGARRSSHAMALYALSFFIKLVLFL